MSAKLLTAMVLLCTASVYTSADPMFNLDFDKYQGTWYLIEFGNYVGTGNGNESLPCLQESYSRRADNPFLADMHWSGGTAESKQELEGLVAFEQQTGAGAWTMFLDNARIETHILSTDYTTWAIEFAFSGAIPLQRIMIRSRTTSLDATILATLHAFLDSLGYNQSAYEYQTVDHSVC